MGMTGVTGGVISKKGFEFRAHLPKSNCVLTELDIEEAAKDQSTVTAWH